MGFIILYWRCVFYNNTKYIYNGRQELILRELKTYSERIRFYGRNGRQELILRELT